MSFLVVSTRIILRRRGLPFPPGPRVLPLIGNTLDFPTSNIPLLILFALLYHTTGPLIYLNVLGQSIIIVDSYDTARELLDKRSKNYSGRPDSVMTRLAMSSDSILMLPYGKSLRHRRRIFHQTLQLSSVNTYFHPHIQHVSRDILLNLLEKPNAVSRHMSFAFVASVLSIAYGIKTSRDDNHYSNMLQQTSELIETAVVPGKYLVELFPAMQHLPAWFPGTGFKKDASAALEKVLDFKRILYEEGMSLLPTGDSMLSLMHEQITAPEGDAAAEEEEQSKNALIETYMGESKFTVASLRAFFLAMAMNPDVQRQAQAELDRVIGRTRLPELHDRDSLPYINALVRELNRWHVVAPIAIPRSALEDDEYNGYCIPKGSIIIPNLWAFSRDPDVYPDPEAFNPDRFLKDGEFFTGALDPHSYIFGFGRRICPGRHLADASLFLACASILYAFNISPPLDDDGSPIKLEAKVVTDRAIA
ncbi:cytochrome P450 [Trametes versicolor FP-101664 SS1]|uniref:cytochrome P450 n=1 Tax=Trametes versicolor (strain FP-101664) TaxID=717944 RepID=UPI0004622CD4|nr:cytochrome P450 [Trametes versicolor FP-101664 SS1]EIW53210.1 cytochrome P450 [Trametes versicolor FP-101664 SS1]